jgi:hypothetical protein
MADPTDTIAMDDVQFATGLKVEPVQVSERAIRRAIREHYGSNVPLKGAAPEAGSEPWQSRRLGQQEGVSHRSEWWRWPLLPFACVLGASLGALALTWVQWFSMKMMGGFSEDGWYYLYVLPLMGSALFGFLWSRIACAVAPRGKIIAGTVMTTVLGMLVLLGVLLILASPGRTGGEKIQAVVGAIATVVGAIVAVVYVYQESDSR